MYDVLLRGGFVIDGSGQEPKKADVAIQGDRITLVGNAGRSEAALTLDVSGLSVSPGFIDIHSHTDTSTLKDSRGMSMVMQGVTTEVAGNCGGSAAPVAPGSARDAVSREGVDVTWSSFLEYTRTLERAGTSLNVASLIGHGNLRRMVIGDGDSPITLAHLNEMSYILTRALDEGAFGLSSGLEYHPGMFANVDELAFLCKTVAQKGAYYSSHMRQEGPGLLDAVREQIAVGKGSGAAIEISHLKSVGPENWGRLPTAISLLEEARLQGIDVTYDLYPYTASSTSLSIILPEWGHDGGREALVARLLNTDIRRRLNEEATARTMKQGGWARIVVTSTRKPQNKRFEGLPLTEIASIMEKEPCDAAFDLLIADGGGTGIIRHGMSDEDVAYGIKYPLGMVCSDGRAMPLDETSGGKVHPRNFGTFPRLLGKYVREDRLLPLQDAIKKITSQPARRAGIAARGLLQPGYFADITVFDAATIKDVATYAEPFQLPTGIRHVFCNGVAVVRDSQHTGAVPGRALLRGLNR
jgi:N-acyl-D-amino-acid deacylase